ncbi:hypothetical protein DR999_PMT14853 [Platysternon megacephalum]|uniref:Uncharacterized protein n=1 Tax=Platysternon megacephalum TaxID=55544 RepID=A0A4D9E3X1_9SAUR|nr:hypothetical protein DR999_PMT14853 [Platysternon megacephalum]
MGSSVLRHHLSAGLWAPKGAPYYRPGGLGTESDQLPSPLTLPAAPPGTEPSAAGAVSSRDRPGERARAAAGRRLRGGEWSAACAGAAGTRAAPVPAERPKPPPQAEAAGSSH